MEPEAPKDSHEKAGKGFSVWSLGKVDLGQRLVALPEPEVLVHALGAAGVFTGASVLGRGHTNVLRYPQGQGPTIGWENAGTHLGHWWWSLRSNAPLDSLGNTGGCGGHRGSLHRCCDEGCRIITSTSRQRPLCSPVGCKRWSDGRLYC